MPRTMHIQLPADLTESESVRLETIFADDDAVLNNSLVNQQLKLEYRFPESSFREIWHKVTDLIKDVRFPALERFRCRLLAFMEENERSHLLGQYGWHSYVRDIYVAHHHLEEMEADQDKLWQTYSSSKAITVSGKSSNAGA